MKPSNLPFIQAELRVIYGIDEQGEQVITTTYCADGEEDCVPDYFTGVMMIEVARNNFLQRHGLMAPRPFDQPGETDEN